MTRGMLRRVQQLEVQSDAATSQRLAIICKSEEESVTDAIARHALVLGEYGRVILRRYGAAACWCRQRGELQPGQ